MLAPRIKKHSHKGFTKIEEIKIIVPKELTEEETQIYKKLKEVSNFEPRKQI